MRTPRLRCSSPQRAPRGRADHARRSFHEDRRDSGRTPSRSEPAEPLDLNQFWNHGGSPDRVTGLQSEARAWPSRAGVLDRPRSATPKSAIRKPRRRRNLLGSVFTVGVPGSPAPLPPLNLVSCFRAFVASFFASSSLRGCISSPGSRPSGIKCNLQRSVSACSDTRSHACRTRRSGLTRSSRARPA